MRVKPFNLHTLLRLRVFCFRGKTTYPKFLIKVYHFSIQLDHIAILTILTNQLDAFLEGKIMT